MHVSAGYHSSQFSLCFFLLAIILLLMMQRTVVGSLEKKDIAGIRTVTALSEPAKLTTGQPPMPNFSLWHSVITQASLVSFPVLT